MSCERVRFVGRSARWALRKQDDNVRDDRMILSLFRAHRRDLVNYASGIVGNRTHAEDMVQEAYLRFHQASGTRLLNEPIRYLYRIVRNLAVDGRRRFLQESQFIVTGEEVVVEQAVEDRPSPEAEVLAKAEWRALESALSELPERTRIALEMHRFGGCKLKEIAAHLGISIALAHALVADGINHCRHRMQEISCKPFGLSARKKP